MSNTTPAPRGLNIGLWIVQVLVAAPFILFGSMKLFKQIETLSASMAWTGTFPEAVVRLIGIIDIAGGLGLLLPGITGIKPDLTRIAAIGSLVLQVCAALFHLSRGEGGMLPINGFFIVLLIFILWGRARAPLEAR
ncbi:DoxX family protein [Novosphingobium sp. BL-52-GroH]|uniref:DoxX family protein n=1 Tax=Novosphingobium sp. BL-52-GroH TaxID=3349877 RepID=UPI003850642A